MATCSTELVSLACIAHKCLDICERCRLWQQDTPATPEHSAAPDLKNRNEDCPAISLVAVLSQRTSQGQRPNQPFLRDGVLFLVFQALRTRLPSLGSSRTNLRKHNSSLPNHSSNTSICERRRLAGIP